MVDKLLSVNMGKFGIATQTEGTVVVGWDEVLHIIVYQWLQPWSYFGPGPLP